MPLFLTLDQYNKSQYSCRDVLFTSYYFHVYILCLVFFFIKLLPIIIYLVFTLSCHITLENDFWYSECVYIFYLFYCSHAELILLQ